MQAHPTATPLSSLLCSPVILLPSPCPQTQPIFPGPGQILLPPRSPLSLLSVGTVLLPTASTTLSDCKWAREASSSDLAPDKERRDGKVSHSTQAKQREAPVGLPHPHICKMDRQRRCGLFLAAPGITVLGEASSKAGSEGTTRARPIDISMETSTRRSNFPHLDRLGIPSPN